MTIKSAVSSNRRSPILVMYNAIVSIGVLSSPKRNDYRPMDWRLSEIDRIVGLALTEMNSEHTRIVAEAIGMTNGKRKKVTR